MSVVKRDKPAVIADLSRLMQANPLFHDVFLAERDRAHKNARMASADGRDRESAWCLSQADIYEKLLELATIK